MAITWTDVVNIAPELSTVATDTQTAILADVALQMPAEVWGTMLDTGSKYLAAHLATVTSRRGGGGAGPLTSETVGQVSRSYAAPLKATSIMSTPYGVEYDRLLMNLPAARWTVA